MNKETQNEFTNFSFLFILFYLLTRINLCSSKINLCRLKNSRNISFNQIGLIALTQQFKHCLFIAHSLFNHCTVSGNTKISRGKLACGNKGKHKTFITILQILFRRNKCGGYLGRYFPIIAIQRNKRKCA